ncbi:MAG: YesL family protein [Anaerolineae bacterium]
MMIQEAMQVFWRSLKDTWEELFSLAIVNLVWFVSWAIPFALVSVSGVPWLTIALLALGLALGAVSTSGMYYAVDRVAHGKTAHFDDWREGVGLYWKRALLWMVVNIAVAAAVVWNILFYGENFSGNWVALMQGVWLALALFWLTMQIYFWPMLIQLEEPRLWTAWRYAAMLIIANPFYAFFVSTFSLLVLIVSLLTGVVLAVAGGTVTSLLGSNGLLILLFKLGKIQDPRPPITN